MIAVTGSVGKTTTKTLCAAVLRAAFPTFCREGNFNSVIGMPLCVPGIGTDVRAAVLEMGMSARGEISALSRAACPDIAVITNIGSSHLESLGTRENIARAKLEVLDGMRRADSFSLTGTSLCSGQGRRTSGRHHAPSGLADRPRRRISLFPVSVRRRTARSLTCACGRLGVARPAHPRAGATSPAGRRLCGRAVGYLSGVSPGGGGAGTG